MKTSSAPSSTPPDCDENSDSFPVRHVADVQPTTDEHKWLIEQLWLKNGVGILTGHPKVCKTFMACELAMAVASGTDALGHFPVAGQGNVLFYGAEDSLSDLTVRFQGLATARNLNLKELPIFLIDTPMLRLEQKTHLLKLRNLIKTHKPILLVLDPFIRIAAIDENSATDVSSVLASLRHIQREYDVAVLVVHHCRKSPATYQGHTMRGSSDFAAWSDSNLYLTRRSQHLSLSTEHRNAPTPLPVNLNLNTAPAPHLQLIDDQPIEHPLLPDLLQNEILSQLEQSTRPLPTVHLQRLLHRRKASIIEALERLRSQGVVERNLQGWKLKKTK